MRNTINSLLHYFLAVGLCISCTAALAVPKAAEQEEDVVTFGEAGAPPKPTAKHSAPPAAKAPKPVEAKVAKRPEAKGARLPASGQAAARKPTASSQSPPAKGASKGTSSSAKAAPATKVSGQAKGKAGKK
ncbi:MAG: hypothetical protein ABTS16_20660 [Candidatus Accumulibacter phosphatis]|jgi:hypothetical protein|uniref:Uncharacterized protein n=2 Tax=Candidatus Accumulibacter TaxID=327159 RepID=A0A084Y6B7_9PROT|nr:hypothetical protein [Candidatus Accumulibacter contiguus]KFB70261.1 MAG: hypothetical protein AW09_004637 [Candidatus Accumulibacter phosphatis]MBL8407012.1 hypothetical protein [Accumulibacter sp.]NMQ04173.1 hypothetical protein [Candidatus Accumulibacter contiguus]HRF10887.1 hypothetical protein [Candidatus Accumulibacter phosphatis]